MPKALYVLPLLVALVGSGQWAWTDDDPTDYPAASAEQRGSGTDFLLVPRVAGELVSVDDERHLITIRNDYGELVQFSYSPTTRVEGIRDSAEGLAQTTGKRMKVYYKEGAGRPTESTQIRKAVIIELVGRAAAPTEDPELFGE